MPRTSPRAVFTVFLAAGLIAIGYNFFLLRNPDFPAGARFAYFALGLAAILVGWYVFQLLAAIEQASTEHQQLERDLPPSPPEVDRLEAELARLQEEKTQLETQQQQLPRVCDLDNPEALPSLAPEQLHILQQLFRDDYRIHVKPLSGGFTNLGVFRVIEEPTPAEKPSHAGYVVKYLKVEDIRREIRVYEPGNILDRYRLRYTPGKVIKSWPSSEGLRLAADAMLGAVCYDLATLEQDSQLQTLAEIYQQSSFDEIEPYLTKLFDERLSPWYRQRPNGQVLPLGGKNGEYQRLFRNRERIQENISLMLRVSHRKLGDLEQIGLFFLPDRWEQLEYRNPIHWIHNVLEPGQAEFFRADYAYSPVHGDLHTSNILIEQGRHTNIWLIDFPNAHIGPALVDFATLEADVKFRLLDENACTLEEWLVFEDRLLAPLIRHPYVGLIWPWSTGWQPENPHLYKAWQFIRFLRNQIMRNRLMGSDVRAYYLALLHATLPVVYRDHSLFQKQCALVSSAWMCEYLGS